ncbi:MAG: hypothetical protein ACKVZJ_01060 [Phycisphaerales bacterium]
MTATITFEEDLTTAFQGVKRSLSEMLTASGANVYSPGECARRLGLNRNLTWKLAKVLSEPNIYTALQHLPGDEGLEIVVTSMRRVAVAPALIDAFTTSLARFDEVVKVHCGDRTTLELILDSMGGQGSAERLEQSRKLAFRGNSGLWGLQARVRSTTTLVAPNHDDPSMMDLCIVGGVIDFRRLRPEINWPLFRPRQYRDDGSPIELGPTEEPVDLSTLDPSTPMLIRDFCSANMPEIKAVRSRLGWDYEMGDGPVGNLGAFTCFFGRIVRKAESKFRSPGNKYFDLLSHVTMPAETMVFDVLVHKDLPCLMTPKVMLVASTDGSSPGDSGRSIPLEERPLELAGRPAMLGTSLIPRYEELAGLLFKRMGREAREFRALRLTIKFPPMHAVTVLRNELPEG